MTPELTDEEYKFFFWHCNPCDTLKCQARGLPNILNAGQQGNQLS